MRIVVRTELLLSAYAKKLLETRRGYRCESYSGSGVRNAKRVLEQEILQQDNMDMIQEAQMALNLEVDKEIRYPDSSLHEIFSEIDRRFGPDAVAIWLGCRPCVIENYCEPGEKPDEYQIPDSAIVISDLGEEGQLFLMSRKDYTG